MIRTNTNTRTNGLTNLRRVTSYAQRATLTETATHTATAPVAATPVPAPAETVAPCAAATAAVPGLVDATDVPQPAAWLASVPDVTAYAVPVEEAEPGVLLVPPTGEIGRGWFASFPTIDGAVFQCSRYDSRVGANQYSVWTMTANGPRFLSYHGRGYAAYCSARDKVHAAVADTRLADPAYVDALMARSEMRRNREARV